MEKKTGAPFSDGKMMYASGEELASAMTRGEETAFQQFAWTYGPRLRGYFVARGLAVTEAESLAVSLVTDIALKVSMFSAEGGGQFDAWTFTLARHGLVNWWRRRPPFVELSSEQLDAIVEETPNTNLVEAVRDGMSKLSATDQEILSQRHMRSGQSYEDIAADLGIEPGTARVRQLRALRRLEAVLRADPRIQQFLGRRQKLSSGGR